MEHHYGVLSTQALRNPCTAPTMKRHFHGITLRLVRLDALDMVGPSTKCESESIHHEEDGDEEPRTELLMSTIPREWTAAVVYT